MLQPSTSVESASNKDENRTGECLSQLRLEIRSVRLPSSSKLVDICVIVEADGKHTYRTQVVRRKSRSTSNSTSNPNNLLIRIEESFDILVTSNSRIKLKIYSPSRLFGGNEIGQLHFNIKMLLDEFTTSDQINRNNKPTSFTVKWSFDSSSSSSTPGSIDSNASSCGVIELTFYGSLLEEQQKKINGHALNSNNQQVFLFKLFIINGHN